MVQLYNIEKVFNATLEINDLLPVICNKVQTLTSATAVNLWLVADGDDVVLMQQAGEDPRVHKGERLGEGDGLVHRSAEDGEPLLFSQSVEDLAEESAEAAGPFSILSAPIVHDGSLTGVIEVVSYDPSHLYTEDDLFTMTQVADSAAQALHHSSLLIAERKIEVLQTLVGISREITATLNRQQVLQAVVNEPLRVIACDRAAIALEERGRLTVRAVSGVARLEPSSPDIAPLQSLLRWVAGLEREIHVWQKDDEISDDRPETREKFRSYFEQSGAKVFSRFRSATMRDASACSRSKAPARSSSTICRSRSSESSPARRRSRSATRRCITRSRSSACSSRSWRGAGASLQWIAAARHRCLLRRPSFYCCSSCCLRRCASPAKRSSRRHRPSSSARPRMVWCRASSCAKDRAARYPPVPRRQRSQTLSDTVPAEGWKNDCPRSKSRMRSMFDWFAVYAEPRSSGPGNLACDQVFFAHPALIRRQRLLSSELGNPGARVCSFALCSR